MDTEERARKVVQLFFGSRFFQHEDAVEYLVSHIAAELREARRDAFREAAEIIADDIKWWVDDDAAMVASRLPEMLRGKADEDEQGGQG